MSRTVNDGAGHPVRIAVQDGALEHEVRDTSGLGGYVVRPGTELVVRQSSVDPDRVQVEQIIGPYGSYPVDPTRNGKKPSLLPVALWLAAPVALLGLTAVSPSRDAVVPAFVPPLMGFAGLTMVVLAVVLAIRRRLQRRCWEAATGVVVDTWVSQRVHPFTVHFATRDGREIHKRHRIASSHFRPRQQQQVQVRYDPANPTQFDVREVGAGTALITVVVIVFGVALSAAGAIWSATVWLLPG